MSVVAVVAAASIEEDGSDKEPVEGVSIGGPSGSG